MVLERGLSGCWEAGRGHIVVRTQLARERRRRRRSRLELEYRSGPIWPLMIGKLGCRTRSSGHGHVDKGCSIDNIETGERKIDVSRMVNGGGRSARYLRSCRLRIPQVKYTCKS